MCDDAKYSTDTASSCPAIENLKTREDLDCVILNLHWQRFSRSAGSGLSPATVESVLGKYH